MPTARELQLRGQQYRNYEPVEFIQAMDTATDAEIRDALRSMESERFYPFLEATSAMFSRLDADEQELFTRRNPVLVQWMSVYNQANDFDPYQSSYDLAESLLAEQPLVKRTGMNQRSARVISDDVRVPPFERPEIREGRTLLADMAYRRRSYRNWSPFEFYDIVGDSNIDPRSFEISEGMAGELGLYDTETRAEIDWPVDVDGDVIARALIERVEAGRFLPMLRAGHRFYAPLDPDESEEWVLQNPGITVWISAFGYMNHKIHSDEITRMTGIDWPPLGEMGGAGGDGGSALDAADRSRRAIERQEGFRDATVKELGSGQAAVDFTITSPDPTEDPRQVKSSFIIGGDGTPDTFVMRFPAIEVADHTREEVVDALGRAIEKHGVSATPFVEGGAISNNPHIDSIRADDADVGAMLPDDPVDLVQTLAAMRESFYGVLKGGDGGGGGLAETVEREARQSIACERLPQVIRDVVTGWGEDPCSINMGECAIFAEEVKDELPEVTIIDNVEFVAEADFTVDFEHAFIECGGRYYDSETPEGVDDWRDLPFFERHFMAADLEGAFIEDGEVVAGGA